MSNETKIKMSKSSPYRGKKRPKNIGEKISKSKIGKSSGRKHYNLSDEHKKKIGLANKGKKMSTEQKEKLRYIRLGSKSSNETRIKQSISMKKTIRNGGHICWKGGVSKENNLIRTGIETKLWREAVFKRDNWTCRKCENYGGKLNAHHIYNFSEYKELRFAIDNGITLCKICHDKFHKIYSKSGNTKEQLIEFNVNMI